MTEVINAWSKARIINCIGKSSNVTCHPKTNGIAIISFRCSRIVALSVVSARQCSSGFQKPKGRVVL
jgi:hypothetical protein